MGIKCVLISSAGIIMCRKLTESLLCSSDQTLNWCWTAESLPQVSAWVTARRRVFPQLAFFCLMSRVESERFKGHGAQISAGHTSRSMWCCMWQYTCHLCSAEKRPSLCRAPASMLRLIKGLKWLGNTRLGFQRSSNQQARDKWLYSPTWTHTALLVRVYSCTLVCEKM